MPRRGRPRGVLLYPPAMDHDQSNCELCLRWEAFVSGYRWTRHDEFVAELARLESDLEELTKELERKRRRQEHLTGMLSKGPPGRFKLPSYPLPPDLEAAKRHHDEAATTEEPPQPAHH